MNGFKGLRYFIGLLISLCFQFALASTTIEGNVTVAGPAAPTGPISGAFVMVSRPQFPSQVLASVKTDIQGNYVITGLPAGQYQVRFSQTGFDDGVMQSHNFLDQATEQLNAQLVPLLTATEIPQLDEKQETTFTINNPNSFPVSYKWQLQGRGLQGAGVAPSGNSILDTVHPPHTGNIQLYVDSVQVQPAQPSDVPPPVVVGNLTGAVASTTGADLPGVQVTLSNLLGSGQTATTFSLTDGSYIFHNEPAGIYKLTYTLAGYFSASQQVFLPLGGIIVPTEFLRPVPPPPTANVTVNVLDSTHNPVPNATVTIAYQGGSTFQQTTNGNGTTQFTNQPVAVHATIVAIATDGSGRTGNANSSGFVAGNNSVTINLPPSKPGALTGLVTGANNAPLVGAEVAVLNASNTVVASALTGGGGVYNINLPSGTYSMTFSLASYVTGSIGGVVVTPGHKTTESIRLVTVTSTQAAITVTVTDGGAPAVGASVTISYSNGTNSATQTTNSVGQTNFTGQPAGVVGTVTAVAGDGTGRSISSTPAAFPAQTTTNVSLALPTGNIATISGMIVDSGFGSGINGVTVTVTDSSGNVVGTTTSSSGTYSVGGLGLQTYTVTFTDNGYLTYVGQTAGNTTLNVRLAPLNATVNVQLDDTFGNPIGGATVTITYVGYNLVTTGTTNSNGFVSIGGQPSTVPAVVSVLTTDGRTASNAQTFNFSNNGVTLTVTSDFGDVSGVAIDNLTSLPLVGATVSVMDFNNNPVATATTNSSGAYVVQNLIPGTYTFTYSDAAYQTLTLTVPATAGVTTTQNASLTPLPGSIQGSVTGSVSQSRVVGATITLNGPAAFTVTSDSGGNFSIGSAPPGNYTGTLSSGIFLQPISATVVSNQVTTLNLILDTSDIVGKVVDQNGSPIPGVQVVLTGNGFTSATLTTDQFGNYVANRESNTGTMTLTATYSVPGNGQFTGTEQISVASTPPVQGAPPIVINVPASFSATVTLGVNPVSGAQVTLNYQTGQTMGPISTLNGLATFNSIILSDPATVSVLYVDGTGTVYTGSVANQSFVPGTNAAAIALSPANNGQSGRISIAVVDQNNNPLGNAFVTIVYSGGATSATLTTDGFGTGSVLFTSQQSGVGATINVSYTDAYGNLLTSSRSVPGGFTNGNNSYAVTVVVPPPANVTIHVVDINQNPVSGALVTITYSNGMSVHSTSTAAGNVTLSLQPDGVPATISVTGPDGVAQGTASVSGFSSGDNPPVVVTIS